MHSIQSLPENRKEVTLPNLFYETNIILELKPDKNITKTKQKTENPLDQYFSSTQYILQKLLAIYT